MNMSDYRKGKDLSTKKTHFTKAPPPLPVDDSPKADTPVKKVKAAALIKASAGDTDKQTTTRHRKVHNRSKDGWYYNRHIDHLRQQMSGGGPSSRNEPEVLARTGETKADREMRREEYRELLDDWFPNEVVKNVFRHHPIHIFTLGKPVWIAMPFVIIALVFGFFFPPLLFLAIPAFLIEIAAIAWYVHHWYRHCLIITDRRIVYLSETTFIYLEKVEIPLDKVQEVQTFSNRNFLEYIFKIGEVKISSSGKTEIRFRHINDPERVRTDWDTLKKPFQAAKTVYRKERMKNYLENKIWGTPIKNWQAEEEPTVLENPGWLERLFPSEPVRDISKKQIVWYTHPWFFFKSVLLLGLAWLAILILGVISLAYIFRLSSALLSIPSTLVFLGGLGTISFMIWYKYENWHNDRYILGNEKILNITKLPFGLDKTVNTVDIRNVQDIKFEKSGVFAQLFDYGSVKITTVGGTPVEVHNIPRPEIIDSEVSRRKEQLKYVEEEKQDKVFADFFAAYRDVLIQGEPPSARRDK